MIFGSCSTAKRADSDNHTECYVLTSQCRTLYPGVVVRESCYPFYEPSYTEPSHGCSQEVQ